MTQNCQYWVDWGSGATVTIAKIVIIKLKKFHAKIIRRKKKFVRDYDHFGNVNIGPGIIKGGKYIYGFTFTLSLSKQLKYF